MRTILELLKLTSAATIGMVLISCNGPDPIKTEMNLPTKTHISDKLPRFDCYVGSQPEMNQCAYQEFLYYDSLMNVLVDSVEFVNRQGIIEESDSIYLISLQKEQLLLLKIRNCF